MNILTEFKALREKLAGFMADAGKATTASIADFSTKLSLLETGALTELENAKAGNTDLTAKLGVATARTGVVEKELADTKTALAGAVAALKLEVKAEATAPELITAMQTAVSTTLAKLGAAPGALPAAAPTQQPGAADPKVKSRADFERLDFKAKAEFMRNGGKLKD